jgi:hypothetical protein
MPGFAIATDLSDPLADVVRALARRKGVQHGHLG